jgi:hypothetical protein
VLNEKKMRDARNVKTNEPTRTYGRMNPYPGHESMICMTMLAKMTTVIRMYRSERRTRVVLDCSARNAPWNTLGASTMMSRRASWYVLSKAHLPLMLFPRTRTGVVVLFRATAPSTCRRYEHVCEEYWWHFMLTRMPSRMALRLARQSALPAALRSVSAWHASSGQRLASK